ncbi:hypothetical protein [Methylobacterium gnaphalii]|uniref:Uncharacterized protein n=1 Tax=Methylobacterium gnaphalii TaxID=1010610 RepID=A0A512JIW0_9HYPH|nr:hypothetical protein [Methylobacterium gnaphalii]GEP09874.1 hypothetical protein MGN01_17190 [Methylobacterium gnaphalii]GJD67210.1 hypothetical protein MMMDOFMJ_0124 [Methylobacterium gnaphalii]GLS49903.1 hypothetical protein GCM10007885_27550 [Methylobacterium gnaphalii]
MAAITATRCPFPLCTCGKVVVAVTDDFGELVVKVVLPRAAAEAFSDEYAAALAGQQPTESQHLRTIRTEGTA